MSGHLRLTAVALAAGAVLASGIAQVGGAPSAEAAVGWAGIDAVNKVMLPQTPFEVTGSLANKTPRTVTLKAKAGSGEKTISTTTSRGDGSFRFAGVRLGASADVRVVTPKQTVSVKAGAKTQARHRKALKDLAKAEKRLTRVKKLRAAGRTHSGKVREAKFKVRLARKWAKKTEGTLTRQVTVKRAESKWTPVSVVSKQSVRIAALPPVAAAGASAAAPTTGSVISAGFVPARGGRPVTLQRLTDGDWVDVSTGVQDRSGHGVFTVQDQGTYRVTTAATAEAGQVISSVVSPRTWALDFEDTFSGTKLDSTKWGPQRRGLGNGLRSCAITDDSSYKVTGGVLRMGVSKDPARSSKTCAYTDDKGVKHKLPYMRNTQVASEGKYTFRYGFAAARVKPQADTGMHSAFWVNATQNPTPGKPELGTEIDVFEYFGNRKRENGVAAFVHVLNKNGVTTKHGDEFDSTVMMKSDKRFSEEFHVFSLEWTPTEYVFRVDGREFHRTSHGVSQVNQQLVLSLLTSSYELVDMKNVNDVAQVDWVRVWK